MKFGKIAMLRHCIFVRTSYKEPIAMGALQLTDYKLKTKSELFFYSRIFAIVHLNFSSLRQAPASSWVVMHWPGHSVCPGTAALPRKPYIFSAYSHPFCYLNLAASILQAFRPILHLPQLENAFWRLWALSQSLNALCMRQSFLNMHNCDIISPAYTWKHPLCQGVCLPSDLNSS